MICATRFKLITAGCAPPGSVSPQIIAQEGLFKLDVDNDIWQDVGLKDDDYQDIAPACWLWDEKVRQGILAILELNHCNKEEDQLRKEHCAMQEWFSEEWLCVEKAKAASCEFNNTSYSYLY